MNPLARGCPLSPRELEVARLIAEDLADKTIASILQISPHTVEAYIVRISLKIHTDRSPLARRRVISRWIEEYETKDDNEAQESTAA